MPRLLPTRFLPALTVALVLAPIAVAATEDDCSVLEARVTEMAGRWFATLPIEERRKAVAEMLGDGTAAVRLASVAELERMLRDGSRPDEALSTRAAALVDDPDPRLRARVGRLLVDLGMPFASDALATRLAREPEDVVIASWLDALALAPVPGAFEPAAGRLRDHAHGDRAARLVSKLVALGAAPIDWKSWVGPVVRVAVADRPTPALATLVAQLGTEADLELASRLLVADDPAIRRGAAQGLLRVGAAERVVARRDDAAIAVEVAAAIAMLRPNLEGFRELMRFSAAGELRASIVEELGAIAAQLDPAGLLAAYAALAADASFDARSRIAILERGARRFVGNESPAAEDAVATLARALRLDNRAAEAAARLEAAKPEPEGTLERELFLARVSAGRFDDAARQSPRVERWLWGLEAMAAAGDPGARAVADEVALRFGGRLGPEDRRRLEAVAVRIAGAGAGARDD